MEFEEFLSKHEGSSKKEVVNDDQYFEEHFNIEKINFETKHIDESDIDRSDERIYPIVER